MKQKIKILLTITMLAILSVIMCITVSAAGSGISTFSVTPVGASEIAEIKWSGIGDKYYIFLPSYAQSDNLTVEFSASDNVYCGDTLLTSGDSTDIFSGGGNLTLTCGSSTYSIVVMEDSSIGSIYVTTESGNMDAVHADKEYKESGEILIIDNDGEVQYDGILDYIKGRGNSTWLLDKKPYNIKLDKKTDLFGMGKSKKWCLLANASDTSGIRNVLAYSAARDLGIDTTTEGYFVNLYLNGEYAGLYLVTEKVEIDENRIDIYNLEGDTEEVNTEELDSYSLGGAQNSRVWGSIKYANIPNDPDEITGGYLLELEKIYRYVNEPCGFITDIGQSVVVKSPEYASKAQVEYISSYYQEFEDALYSPTGYNAEGKHYSDYIDVDSLARMYILEEFANNFDGCSSSFFLYKDVDNKLVAGPLWDFDLSLGQSLPNDLINHVPSNADTSLLYIQTCFIGNHNEAKNGLLAQAFSHNDFQELVQDIWNNEFDACYDSILNNIENLEPEIVDSATMNAVRWNTFQSTDIAYIQSCYTDSINSIRNHVTARYPFLSQAYAEDTYFVKYDIMNYGTTLVNDTTIYRSGDTAVIKNSPTFTDKSTEFIGWATEPDCSGTIYKPGDEITVTGNTKLYATYIKKNAVEKLNDIIQKISDILNHFVTFFSIIYK